MSERRSGWAIADGEDFTDVANVNDLEVALDQIHAGAQEMPSLVRIIAPTGPRLLIGLGGPYSVLQFSDADDPPYLVSLGERNEEGVAVFFCQDQKTEVERRRLILHEGARHAARLFFETGSKPTCVRWAEI